MTRLGRCLALAALAALATCDVARATFPGSTGDAVWYCGEALCVGNPLAPEEEPRRIATGRVSDARWSADGTTLFYVKSQGSDIYSRPAAGDGAERQITDSVTPAYDLHPAPSPDGTEVAYVRQHSGENPYAELRIANLDTGGDRSVFQQPLASFSDPEWSPDGSRIALVSRTAHGTFDSQHFDLYLASPSGGAQRVYEGRRFNAYESANFRAISWAPDGQHLAFAPYGETQVRVFGPDGTPSQDQAIPAPPGYVFGVTYTPDGARALVQVCDNDFGTACTTSVVRVQDARYDFDDAEPAVRPGRPVGFTEFDFQPAEPPIIFVHGYAGSGLGCTNTKVWPPPLIELTQGRLDATGDGNAADTCGPAVTGLVESVLGSDVYGGALENLDALSPGNVSTVVWDWRRDPADQMHLLDAAIDAALSRERAQAQALDRVILVGHSFGGLFIREAIDDAARRARVQRVLTLGTPYLGAPKALFPLLGGFETPQASVLDGLLDNDELRSFARNLTGNYFLYPTADYGSWLTVGGQVRDFAGVREFVRQLGGSPAAFDRALHPEIAGFRRLDPLGLHEYRAVVGTGEGTITAVRLGPGGAGDASVTLESGDGTVPSKSGAQGEQGTSDPLGEDIPISYVCGIGHVELAGEDEIYDRFGDFIRYGTPPLATQPCDAKASVYTFEVGGPGTRAAGSASALIAQLQDHDVAGRLDALDFPGAPSAVVDAGPGTPAPAISVSGVRFRATGRDGAVRHYGPVTGTLALGVSDDGNPQPLLDGNALQPGAAPPPAGSRPRAKVRSVRLKRGRLTVAVRNTGATPLAAKMAVKVSGKGRKPARWAKRVRIAPGRTVRLRFPKLARKLRKTRRLSVEVRVLAGGGTVTQRRLKLKPGR